jgi:hypothetical protein
MGGCHVDLPRFDEHGEAARLRVRAGRNETLGSS